MEKNENGVVPQHEESKMVDFGPSSKGDDGLLESLPTQKTKLRFFQNNITEVWPVVESALLEHDMSGELVDNCMRVSTTEKTRDPKILDKAKGLTRLLARNFPARLENFYKRRGRLIGPEKSTLKALCKVTGCYVIVSGFSIPATGSSEGLQVVKRIVDDCFQNGTSPASLIWLERRRKVADKITVDKPFGQIGIRPSIDVGRYLCSSLLELVKTQLICCEHTHKKFYEALHQGHFGNVLEMIQDTDVLEKITEKFISWDSPEVHANTAETLCAVARFAPPGLATKISSPSFIGRLFQHALEDSRPQYVLINLLSVCLYLLDPARLNSRTYENFGRLQITHGSVDTANSETVVGMLEILGDLLKLLDVSTADNVLLTTYGKLQPPLGQHRLKIVEFIAVLLRVGGETVEKELIRLGAIQRILALFFKYPFNNFVHHHIENIIVSCLESKNARLVQHLLCECDLVGRILTAENNYTLETDPNRPTVPDEGRSPPRNPAVQEEMCDMEDDYRAVELILPTSPCRKKRRCSPTDNDSEDDAPLNLRPLFSVIILLSSDEPAGVARPKAVCISLVS
ncbi:serine/threonine-protein phosphatase 6 regulatory subunit 3-B-like [Pyrus ussuriensis x Pyrus communis]|uniref:Serine/threonine-protein phosphatase 6 regulatory subunit 3-B-like n=1 Tax=Pyrus ussuriensis x Pyrus communis TaxID=2448454 RepID=A0A5N5GI82_9ROSA|nr:serine/threonine-protein phosphatase 6 regulatory subunit 3-B-like [Pyrus ussuriensis x Pyrus communis]